MTVKSMTGYSSRDGTLDINAVTYNWTWDIRSVNGKSLDMRLRVPNYLNDLDQVTRKRLTKKLARGNLQVSLLLDTTRHDATLTVNEKALQAVVDLSKKLNDSHDICPVTMDGLLATRGILEFDTGDVVPENKKDLLDALMRDFDAALDGLVISREDEGKVLQEVLEGILVEVENLACSAKNAPERTPDVIRGKLNEQINSLMEGEHDLSEERLHHEALLIASKTDIKEEVDRLEAHVIAARNFLILDEPTGRRLDFLAQELNREANTLCSKASDIAITNIGLSLKAAIEQFREQIQNVE